MRIECVIPFHSNSSLFYIWMYVCVVFVNERDKDSSTAELRFASQGLHCYMMYLFIFTLETTDLVLFFIQFLRLKSL